MARTRVKLNESNAPQTGGNSSRVRTPIEAAPAPSARPRAADDPTLVSSGSVLLDLVLGGGWKCGRISNVVGDRSSGKTLLAIEALANFSIAAPEGKRRYLEAESAFDEEYAKQLGFPNDVERNEKEVRTVEDFDKDLTEFCGRCDPSLPNIYVVDSLDALSDEAEMEREIDKGSYGAAKAKKLSELFRRRVGVIEDANVHLMVISQIRDKIGVTFGETKTRSGGRALDFYASQILWLAEIQKVKRTKGGIERAVGIITRAKTKKNKVGLPFRECDLTILFGYGVDDQRSMLDWLKKAKALKSPEGLDKEIAQARSTQDRAALNEITAFLAEECCFHWQQIEDALAPPMKKYG